MDSKSEDHTGKERTLASSGDLYRLLAMHAVPLIPRRLGRYLSHYTSELSTQRPIGDLDISHHVMDRDDFLRSASIIRNQRTLAQIGELRLTLLAFEDTSKKDPHLRLLCVLCGAS